MLLFVPSVLRLMTVETEVISTFVLFFFHVSNDKTVRRWSPFFLFFFLLSRNMSNYDVIFVVNM